MFGVLRQTWALMLGILLLQLGNGLQGTLIGIRGNIEGMSTESLGVIMSFYFVGFLGGSKLTPRLIKRVGHVRVFAALGSMVSAVFILYIVWIDPYFWSFLRFVVGFCISGLYVIAESWLNDSSQNDTRGKTLSLYIMVQMIGITVGQLLLNTADPAGHILFVMISIFVSFSFAPILLSVSPAPMVESTKPMSIKELFKTSPLGCVGTTSVGFCFGALFGMTPIYATAIGLNTAEITYFIASIYVGGMLFQYPIGWLSDRMDRRALIAAVALFGGFAALVPMLVESPNFKLLIICSFLVGGAGNPLYSLVLAHTNDFLQRDQMAAASGSMLFLNGIGAMLGPVTVGFTMQKIGPQAYYLFIMLCFVIIAVYSFYRMTQRETPEETVPFVYLSTRTTAVAAEFGSEIVIDEIEAKEADEAEAEAEAEADKSKPNTA